MENMSFSSLPEKPKLKNESRKELTTIQFHHLMLITADYGWHKFLFPDKAITLSQRTFFIRLVNALEQKQFVIGDKVAQGNDSYAKLISRLTAFANFGEGVDNDDKFEIHEETKKLRAEVLLLNKAYAEGDDAETIELLKKVDIFSGTMNTMVQNGFYPSAHVQVRIDALFDGEQAN